MSGASPNDWMTRKQAASYLTEIGCPVTPSTLANKAANNNGGGGPSFTIVGERRVRYQRRDLDAWAQAWTRRVS